jgi:hypothetical protein
VNGRFHATDPTDVVAAALECGHRTVEWLGPLGVDPCPHSQFDRRRMNLINIASEPKFGAGTGLRSRFI